MSSKYTFTIYVGRVLIVIGYFLFKKEAFNGLLKVVGIQNLFFKEREEINMCVPLLMLYYIFIQLTKFSINHFWTMDLTLFMKLRFFMHFWCLKRSNFIDKFILYGIMIVLFYWKRQHLIYYRFFLKRLTF